MDEEELLLQGDDGAAVITDHLDEDQLLNGSINGDAGSVNGDPQVVFKTESLDHEELDYEEDDEKEERESRFTSERAKKSPIRAPEDATPAATATKTNENSGFAARGSYRGRVMRGGAGFNTRGGGNFNMRGGMRMVAGGGSVGPISLLTSNIPPPMMMGPPGIGGPLGKILVNPNFPVGAGLTMLPNGPGFGAPPMALRAPMMPQPQLATSVAGPKVTLSIDGAPALAVPVSMQPRGPPPQQMGPGPGQMQMPPPNMGMRPVGLPPGAIVLNQMAGPPPSAMRFPPGMGPPPMAMTVPPPGMVPQMMAAPGGAPQMAGGNWNLMVEAFLGDKKASAGSGEKRKKRRRRSRSSSYSSSSDSESYSSESSRSRSRSRSPRRNRKRSSRGSRKSHRKERGERSSRGGEKGGERRVFRTGPNSFRINSAPTNELPSLMDGIDRRGSGGDRERGADRGAERGAESKARRADRERQRETDTRDSARVLGLSDDYLQRVEEQKRQREEMRRRREGRDGQRDDQRTSSQGGGRDRAPASSSSRGRTADSTNGGGAAASGAAAAAKKKPEGGSSDESKRKAYLAVHVKSIGHLGEAALGRIKALANEVGETKKVWRSADDVVTVIFVELDKAKAFMLKYNGKVLSGLRITVGLEKVYLNLSEVPER